ncbi:unnamed protein product [Trichogramma brassicae]|uniref:Gag-like protein n=1 Tax=Trichogramma brassicae TaxID=86971 RepID=A0A6H5I8B4_9HYME|nr:unnamed protein product [Trichogramma brassicae]
MADETNKTTPGGNLQNVVNPPGDSYRVKAPVVAGCPSDSGEGTFSDKIMNVFDLALGKTKNQDEIDDKVNKETPEVVIDKSNNQSRRNSVSSNTSETSRQSDSASIKRKRSILDVGEPGPELDLYLRAEDELKTILHTFDLRAKKRQCAERLDEVPERLQVVRRLLLSLAFENANLRGRLSISEASVSRISRKELSFAQAVQKPKSGTKDQRTTTNTTPSRVTPNKTRRNSPMRRRFTALVKSGGGEAALSVDEVKKTLVSSIDPVRDKIGFNGIRKTRDGVIIDVRDAEELKRIRECKNLTDKGLTISEPIKNWPKVAVHDVQSTYSPDYVIEAIFAQNTGLGTASSLQEFKSLVRFKFKMGPRKDSQSCTYVLEVTPALRKDLIASGRLYIGMLRCRVSDFKSVTICYKCQWFNHTTVKCKEAALCHKCAGPHDSRTCEKEVQDNFCALCKHRGRPHAHRPGPPCPLYQEMARRLKQETDYGT